MNLRILSAENGERGRLVLLFLLVCSGYTSADTPPGEHSVADDPRSVRSSTFHADMVRLDVEGHNAFILKPAKTMSGDVQPWVWYAPTSLADDEENWISPGKRHAWVFRRLLAGGVCVAGVDVGESYGSPAGQVIYDRFHALLVSRYGFSPKPGLLPISRGGLMAYNWAANRPDCVACIGGIYPVCNLKVYPSVERLAKPYGMSIEELRTRLHQHNPVARLRPLAAAHVPILHIHGDRDKVVPLQAHSSELVGRYQALGGTAELIVVPGKGHEIAPEYWQEPRLIDFFLKHVLRPRGLNTCR